MAADEKPALTGMTQEELVARVRELEAELARKERAQERREREHERRERAPATPQLSDTVRDVSARTYDETNRLVRGITLAHLEGFRAVADVLGAFADEMARRNPPEDRNAMINLGPDMVYAGAEAISRAVDVPRRAVNRFAEAYREEGEEREQERDRERERERRRERERERER